MSIHSKCEKHYDKMEREFFSLLAKAEKDSDETLKRELKNQRKEILIKLIDASFTLTNGDNVVWMHVIKDILAKVNK